MIETAVLLEPAGKSAEFVTTNAWGSKGIE